MHTSTTRRVSANTLVLAVALLLASIANLNFWSAFIHAVGGFSLARLPLIAGSFAIVVLLFHGLLTPFSFRFVAKPALILFLLTASASAWFINQYGVVIDKAIIQSIFETDTREAAELLSWRLVLFVAMTGGLPALLVARANVRFPAGVRGIGQRAGIAAGSLAVAALLLVVLFKSLAPAVREHRELRYLLTPTNAVQAMNSYLRNRWSSPVPLAPLGRDAAKGSRWAGQARRTVTVIVVGETARAANFSLNGYARDTNPQLAREQGLVNFANVQSCGTATAVSVPCVFSSLGHDRYDDTRAKNQEGLLDVLSHAGFSVLWRDNNSGCKGVCDRVAFTDLSTPRSGNSHCDGDECHDEGLLEGLPDLIKHAKKDQVIVLHQKGSHGPAYAKRYPHGFGRFGPVCETSEFESCSRDAIVAAYDNTILYTDFFLAKTIDLLRGTARAEGVDTAMFYFSDHGESLGEGNMYLHGAPYLFAPKEQTHVPMMLWMSDGFSQRFRIDRACLQARRDQPLSHDNVFHSVLGMLNVETAVLNPKLDLFHACVRNS
ncbi:phosphoethanolamine transferase [Massilia yuzhufengensis]|uniref:Phosphatidylethanolamine:Kdo2-lipid A phosphoethanolamine transferase n=1 Tax=Massilia yuzhufengensis TaxID=1164594 RepID=A0A1I1HMK8_9BURK|nr:phosphoethanolamine--lipid A transferase [Massilia yuzhufengensis]SFC22693.1 phosphatidylethanolamine:Kdo2-lipid A phosphoethanolamine transferase [Massilia yuzhufengensis]